MADIDLGISGIQNAVEIGVGGFSTVYHCHQLGLNRSVAVKVIKAHDPKTLRQFKREQKALGTMTGHPGVVMVFEVGTTDFGQPYLIMQYCPGGSLAEQLERDGTMPSADATAAISGIALTIADAHDLNIVHRDLKPANILIDANGNYLVADFGLAALVDSDSGFTRGSVAYSPGFTALETLNGSKPEPASDVYSLGATLYRAVTGNKPFHGVGEEGVKYFELMSRMKDAELDDPRRMGVPDHVARLIEQCTHPVPEQRPTMREMASLATGASTFQPPPPATYQPAPPTVRQHQPVLPTLGSGGDKPSDQKKPNNLLGVAIGFIIALLGVVAVLMFLLNSREVVVPPDPTPVPAANPTRTPEPASAPAPSDAPTPAPSDAPTPVTGAPSTPVAAVPVPSATARPRSTSTPAPTLTPVPERVGELVATGVRVRSAPSLAAREVYFYDDPPAAADLRIVGAAKEGWYKVVLNGEEGWLFGAFVIPPDDDLAVVRTNDRSLAQILQSNGAPSGTPNASGSLVLVVYGGDELWEVLLPDGTTGWIRAANYEVLDCGDELCQ